ncbi:hypothetical protein Tsubulata_012079, partial [Turnera subulata]
SGSSANCSLSTPRRRDDERRRLRGEAGQRGDVAVTRQQRRGMKTVSLRPAVAGGGRPTRVVVCGREAAVATQAAAGLLPVVAGFGGDRDATSWRRKRG